MTEENKETGKETAEDKDKVTVGKGTAPAAPPAPPAPPAPRSVWGPLAMDPLAPLFDGTLDRRRREFLDRISAPWWWSGEPGIHPSAVSVGSDDSGRKATVYRFDLPGVDRDGVDVSFDKGTLSVRASADLDGVSRSYEYHIDVGGVDPTDIRAKMENGILTVSIPAFDSGSATDIPVR